MAPVILENAPDLPQTKFSNGQVDKSVFPDGIKTSGQHDPIYDQLKPYAEFPQEVRGPTVWRAEDYRNNPERWTHLLSETEIDELSKAADEFIAADIPLTGITRDNFQLPSLGPFLRTLRTELLDGKGFILIKNFPASQWTLRKSATAYMGLGTYLGYFVSQNGRGHVLGHVKDLGEDSTQIDKVRIYRTNARQFFHADDCDIVGLLCIARALEGGESDIVSSHHVWNTLQRERPDVAATLAKPIWYFDRKGETSRGQAEYIRTSVFYIEPSPSSSSSHPNNTDGRVYCKWDPYYVRSLTRFSSTGEIPPLSAEQEEALQVLEQTCNKLALHMVLEVGDIQFLSNAHVLHARTAYTDYAAETGRPRRHLMRLWLGTPEAEGGWKLPFRDSKEKKRGGIQVDDHAPVCPLDAE